MSRRYHSYRTNRRRSQWAVNRYLAAFEATTRAAANGDRDLSLVFMREVAELKTLQKLQTNWDRKRFQ